MDLSKTLNNLYPDLTTSGGLTGVLQSALREIGSNLIVSELDKTINLAVYSRVESGPRFSQVSIASEQRLLLLDFWARGVCLANAQTASITAAAAAIDKWMVSTCTSAELADAFTFVVVDKEAAVYQRGEETSERWSRYIESIGFPELQLFVKAAFGREGLKQLFPYTSHSNFCFSRCTGYPFTRDIPFVRPMQNGKYQVVSASGVLLGEGNAQEAAELVEANLPPNCGPAVPGTADDLASS